MKAGLAAAAAVAAVGAYAQGDGYGYGGGGDVSYTTVTYDDCPTSPPEQMITVTNGVTVTYCPECNMGGYTTIYTTVYESLCPTGIVPATYTITESCTEPTPTWTPGPHHIPPGFTVTTKMCTVCDTTPKPVTITDECGCEAHEGTPAPNWHPSATESWSSGSGWTGATPTPGSGSGSPPECNGEECGGSAYQGSSPSPSCNGEDCGGSASQGSAPAAPPYPSTTAANCPGPNCVAKATGGLPPGVSYGNSSGIAPATPPTPPAVQKGAASRLDSLALLSSSLTAAIVAGLAFAL